MPRFTASDGTRLHYVESGDAGARPIVLIAGFKASASSWRYQVKPLTRAGYRVIAFDRRGHGASEVGPDAASSATMDRHGADIGDLVAHLGLRDATLVGQSMGGNAIWAHLSADAASTAGRGGAGGSGESQGSQGSQAAAAATASAGRAGVRDIRDVVIVDQTPKMLNTDDWAFGFYDYDASNADTMFATGIPDPGRFPAKSKGLVRIARVLTAMDLPKGGRPSFTAAELALLNDHAKRDWRPAIAAADIPTFFIAGAESEFWPSAHAAASAALNPLASSTVIERDGHATNIEQPARFNEELLAFLAR
ncbi:pimeloyl-ACP methyl ester carboxylesterase [Agromyces terreus]|uniref:Pimeloyl-ACP methyl ester carboxylesterase n=1 Tax=Agromyces terreus TaxID=424795 RepID=A0A9X2H4A2_9MICO|nr:alpha/beta hydrolase [Agromyces terreus]MCP2370517.1 pimeloyl-ACP methyl ester carboxylesterase [Agromyces terreus]